VNQIHSYVIVLLTFNIVIVLQVNDNIDIAERLNEKYLITSNYVYIIFATLPINFYVWPGCELNALNNC